MAAASVHLINKESILKNFHNNHLIVKYSDLIIYLRRIPLLKPRSLLLLLLLRILRVYLTIESDGVEFLIKYQIVILLHLKLLEPILLLVEPDGCLVVVHDVQVQKLHHWVLGAHYLECFLDEEGAEA